MDTADSQDVPASATESDFTRQWTCVYCEHDDLMAWSALKLCWIWLKTEREVVFPPLFEPLDGLHFWLEEQREKGFLPPPSPSSGLHFFCPLCRRHASTVNVVITRRGEE